MKSIRQKLLVTSLSKPMAGVLMWQLFSLNFLMEPTSILFIMLSNSISLPIKKCVTRIEELSEGDLKSPVPEVAATINEMSEQIRQSADNAAHAGEAGKGFAVVAEEVRNLAIKSQETSKNTSTLIEGSLKAIDNGRKIANETAQAMNAVVSGVEQVTVSINDISETSSQQAQSASQVSVGIDQISAVVQTNSATAEESAASSEELSNQAQSLKNLVNRFQLDSIKRNFSEEPVQKESSSSMPRFLPGSSSKY